MTKRKDLMKIITAFAKEQSLSIDTKEGGNHTRIWVGDKYTIIPRHKEIPNDMANKILRQIGAR